MYLHKYMKYFYSTIVIYSYYSVISFSLIGLRLSEKRMFPCPDRNKWLETRDEIYEEIMTRAWNPELRMFSQSYESPNVLDSSLLIMPLVFFISPTDPRFLDTMNRILRSPGKGKIINSSNECLSSSRLSSR